MLLMTSNTRSGGVGQGRASFSAPRSGRSAAQSLDGRRSGGYSATNAQGLCFQHVHAQEPLRLRAGTENTPIYLQLPHSTSVHAQQPVNASVFAPCGRRPLIPLWFPQRNFKFLCSTHSGVTCHPHSDAVGSALLLRSERPPEEGHGATKKLLRPSPDDDARNATTEHTAARRTR
jgi:hypothetical protein